MLDARIRGFLQTKLGVALTEYELLTEIPFAVKVTSETPGGFMKADVVLVKYNELNEIEDVIVLESKLRGTTRFTPAQKLKFAEVKSAAVGSKVKFTVKFEQIDDLGETIFEAGQSLNVPRSNVVRISDHGNSDIDGLLLKDLKFVDEIDDL